MNVLLVDDDKDTTFLMGILLGKSASVDSHRIATSPTEALRLLENNEIQPDCIFVDLQMPEMSGFEFVERYELLLVEKFPQTRLYILSGSAIPEDREAAKKYKTISGFINKPLGRQQLEHISSEIAGGDPVEVSSPVCYGNSTEIRDEYKGI